MAKSPPSTPFYWNDYFRDTRVLQPASRGIWMDLLCKLHESGRRGEVTLPLASWLQWCSCPQDVFFAAAQDIVVTEVGMIAVSGCDIRASVTLYHDDVTVLVTVKNRRMLRESKARESERLRQQKSRKSRAGHVDGHASVLECHTAPSSSFSSSPSHWEPPSPPLARCVTDQDDPERGDAQRAGRLGRLSESLKGIFDKHLGASGSLAGEGTGS